jgi:hypothetical protein
LPARDFGVLAPYFRAVFAAQPRRLLPNIT